MAEVVLPVAPDALVEDSKTWFVNLGFALVSIVPADDPREAVLQGHGLRLRLRKSDRALQPAGAVLRLTASSAGVGGEPRTLIAPNGTVVEVVEELDPPLPLPPLQETLHISRMSAQPKEVQGRAGMMYRDLIPSRLGGRFIASHIRIAAEGPVRDMVHFHVCRFQIIFCVRGSVLLVYEDQGEPFWLRAGDCVLQPPGIRHKVIQTPAGGVEVLEVGSPSEHLTVQDLDMNLPTQTENPSREWAQDYDGAPQRFVRHDATAESAEWLPHPELGCSWEFRDCGVAAATKGLGSCIVSRRRSGAADHASEPAMMTHDGELVLWFVLRGECTLHVQEQTAPLQAEVLRESDSIVLPSGCGVAVMRACENFEMVEVIVGRSSSAGVLWSRVDKSSE